MAEKASTAPSSVTALASFAAVFQNLLRHLHQPKASLSFHALPQKLSHKGC